MPRMSPPRLGPDRTWSLVGSRICVPLLLTSSRWDATHKGTPRVCLRRFALLSFESVLSVTRSQEGVNHEIRDVTAQLLAGGEVKAEVGPGEDSAQRGLFRRS